MVVKTSCFGTEKESNDCTEGIADAALTAGTLGASKAITGAKAAKHAIDPVKRAGKQASFLKEFGAQGVGPARDGINRLLEGACP